VVPKLRIVEAGAIPKMVWRDKVHQNSLTMCGDLLGVANFAHHTFHCLYINTVRLNFASSCFSISFLSLHQHGLFSAFDDDVNYRKRVLGGVVAAMLRLLSLVRSPLPCASFRAIFCILSRRSSAFSHVVAFCSAAFSHVKMVRFLVPAIFMDAGVISFPCPHRYCFYLLSCRQPTGMLVPPPHRFSQDITCACSFLAV
jgi:hypothetical protein